MTMALSQMGRMQIEMKLWWSIRSAINKDIEGFYFTVFAFQDWIPNYLSGEGFPLYEINRS